MIFVKLTDFFIYLKFLIYFISNLRIHLYIFNLFCEVRVIYLKIYFISKLRFHLYIILGLDSFEMGYS